MSSKNLGLTGLLIALVIALPLFVLSFTNMKFDIREKAAPSTTLLISPTYQDLNPSQDFNLTVGIDSGENIITGIDIELVFDPKIMQVNEINPTASIANLNNIIKKEIDNTNGKLRFATYTGNTENGIKGNFSILTLPSKILSSATNGAYKVSFTNLTTAAAVGEGVNVVNNLTEANINIVSAVGGLPNSCGGTCGSNDNCIENLYCYQGYCKNPSCSDNSDCNCSVVTQTATPTPIKSGPTQKPKATITPTTKPIDKGGNFIYIPEETVRPDVVYSPIETESPDLLIDTEDLKNKGSGSFVKYIFGILAIAICGIIYTIWKGHKRNIPHIMPPTNI